MFIMQLRIPLLLSGSALFAIAAMPSSDLPKEDVERLEHVLMRRLSETNTYKFGINRIGEPHISHVYSRRLMRPESDEESALIKSLQTQGWNAVVYTISAKNSRRPNGAGQIVNGPAFIAALEDDLPTNGNIDVLIEKVRAMRDAPNPGFTYKGWRFMRKDVKALSACTPCHRDASGNPVKVGDVIGHLAIGYRKMPK
jgi:hypothetical protein